MEVLAPLMIIGSIVTIVIIIEIITKKLNKPKEELKHEIIRLKNDLSHKVSEIEKLKKDLELIKKQNNELLLISNEETKKILQSKENYKLTSLEISQKIKNLGEKLYQSEKNLFESKEIYNKELSDLKEGITKKDELFNQLKIKPDTAILKITSLMSDFLTIQYAISSKYLKEKKHPAISEAKRINQLQAETKIAIEKYKMTLYKYEYLLQIFPELTNYVDDFSTLTTLGDHENFNFFIENYDKVIDFLSKEEYLKLSADERNQIALDRYIKGKKSNWEIGRDYELFCGLEYQKNGFKVEFFGMEKKLEDMGRDLIAIRNTEHHIIQCKYWSKNKTIHEKHITQLYGSAVEYSMNRNDNPYVLPVFITNTNLSEKARKFAKKLGVVVRENKELGEFPRIKCNLNKDQYGVPTKIYHLPFDQQYDKTRIEYSGEFYTHTVKEAVEKGFRRAYKHFG